MQDAKRLAMRERPSMFPLALPSLIAELDAWDDGPEDEPPVIEDDEETAIDGRW